MESKFQMPKRKTQDDQNGVLMPIMSLMIILIPFLIGNMAFFHVKAIDANIPGKSSGETTATKKSQNMNVIALIEIERQKFTVELIDEDSGKILDRGKFDEGKKGLENMRSKLLGMKKKYRKFELLLVSANKTLKYNRLIEILDSCIRPQDKKSTLPEFKLVVVPKEGA